MSSRARLAAALLSVSLAGCDTIREDVLGMDPKPEITEEELHQQLAEFAGRFSRRIQDAADETARATEDPAVRRDMTQFKLRALPAIRTALYQDNAKAAFLDMWTLLESLDAALQEGTLIRIDDKVQKEKALQVVAALREDLLSIGREFLSEKALAEAQKNVQDFAKNPHNRLTTQPLSIPGLSWIAEIPMAPFRAFQGIDDTAQAIRHLSVVADEFTSVVDDLPEETRWQAELLLYDIEERKTTKEALASFAALSDGVERIGAAATDLPKDTEAVIDHAFGQLDQRNDNLRALLVDAKSALAELRAALGEANQTAQHLKPVTDGVAAAGDAWNGTFATLRDITGNADDPEPPDAKPFDINEYASAVQDVSGAAVELRGTIDALNELVSSARAGEKAADVIDHAFWRTLQVLGAFFALLLVYKVVARFVR